MYPEEVGGEGMIVKTALQPGPYRAFIWTIKTPNQQLAHLLYGFLRGQGYKFVHVGTHEVSIAISDEDVDKSEKRIRGQLKLFKLEMASTT